jgi:hypothetical protein
MHRKDWHDEISYHQGVPGWFTRALHVWSKRRCRRIGHQDGGGRSWMCGHCGEIL